MDKNEDKTWVNQDKVISAAKTVPATLLVLILATMGCARILAQRNADLIAGSDATTFEGRQRKVFTNWTPVQSSGGTCHSRNGKLILYPDGSRELEVELMTTDAGEIWEQNFHFFDNEKPDHTWFGSRMGGSFDIPYRNVWTYFRYRRSAADLKLAAAFDRIRYVVWSVRC